MINYNQISINLNQLFSRLFDSIDTNLLNVLDELVFIDKSILNDTGITQFIGTEFTNGTITIALSISIGIILYLILNNLISYLTFKQNSESLNKIFKYIFVLILIIASKEILGAIFSFNSFIGNEVEEIGKSIIGDERVSFEKLITKFNKIIVNNDNIIEFTSFDGIIKIFVSIGLMNLLFEYAVRYVVIKINCIITPIMLSISLFTDNYSVNNIFRNWLRNFVSTIFLQNLILLVLIMTLSINLEQNDTLTKLIFLGTIYCLIKGSRIMGEAFGGNNIQSGISVSSMMRGG